MESFLLAVRQLIFRTYYDYLNWPVFGNKGFKLLGKLIFQVRLKSANAWNICEAGSGV